MDLDSIKAQLETWVGAITASTIGAGDGLPVEWRDAPSGWRADHGTDHGYALCWLGLPVTIGRDAIEWEEDLGAPGAEETPWQRGQREFTFEIQIRTQRSTPGYSAREYARRIRDRLQLPDWSSIFETAEIAFQQVASEVDLGEIVDDGVLSAAQIDIIFNARADEAGTPTTYIAVVEAATDFKLPDGSTSPVQFSGEIPIE